MNERENKKKRQNVLSEMSSGMEFYIAAKIIIYINHVTASLETTMKFKNVYLVTSLHRFSHKANEAPWKLHVRVNFSLNWKRN